MRSAKRLRNALRAALCGVLLMLLLAGCAAKESSAAPEKTPGKDASSAEETTKTDELTTPEEPTKTEEPAQTDEPTPGAHILVACFSATGHTEPLAEYAAEFLGADLYEIVAAEPYTEADLAYYTGGRCDLEQDDPDVRPAISGAVENMEQYDVVLIGHPIWHGQAPRIISTFLESYDFSGKTLTTFCTSMSSPLGSSAANLYGLVPEDVTWLESRRFPIGASREDVAGWLAEIGLTGSEGSEEAALQMRINGIPVAVQWEDNESVEALIELVREAPLTIQMSMYGGFEQVGAIGSSLPRNDVQTTTHAGDIVLYSGNQFVVFYGSNSWAYTRLGHITDKTAAELAELLGNGNVTVTISVG